MALSDIRWGHLSYLAAFGLFGAFAVGLFGTILVEVNGPTQTVTGSVTDRLEGERESCTRPVDSSGRRIGREVCRTYPIFSVVGVRDGGSAWVVAGEDVYRTFAVGEAVQVTSSSITRRVVAIDAGEARWSLQGSGMYPFSAGVFFVALFFGVAYEMVRQTQGRFVDGPFQRSDARALVPGIVVGLAAAWFVLFWKTVSL